MTKTTMTVEKIVKAWLVEHGYDGLWHDTECDGGCLADNLMTCVECGGTPRGTHLECKPGYKYETEDGPMMGREKATAR